jgi:TetR/AcrR family transcriptional regulator
MRSSDLVNRKLPKESPPRRGDRSDLTEPPHKRTKTSRSKGKRSGSESSKDILLAAARVEFAARGLEGARIDSIAERSGVNKQLVYHYFGSKDVLYQAVLEDAYTRFVAPFAHLDNAVRPASRRLKEFIEFLFDRIGQDPQFQALITDENVHSGRHVKRSGAVKKILTPVVENLAEILDQAKQDGSLDCDIDPIDLYLDIAGMSAFYFTNMHTLSAALNRNLRATQSVEQRREHVVRFVLSALRTK